MPLFECEVKIRVEADDSDSARSEVLDEILGGLVETGIIRGGSLLPGCKELDDDFEDDDDDSEDIG
jgi:hypothetical protein